MTIKDITQASLSTIWHEHKVRIVGILTAMAMPLYQFVNTTTIDWYTVATACMIAGISWIAKNWRGQGMSVGGIITNAAIAFVNVHETGHMTLNSFILQFIVAAASAAMPDPKSRGYEAAPAIREAKIQGEIIQPTVLTNNSVRQEAQAIIAEAEKTQTINTPNT